jgi:phthiocerol/phenolphthiocerol synthesis type-I polyketide synthase B
VPDAVVGHSMGEVGAAYLAGVLNLDQAMRIICRRSALMRATSGQGAMAVIDLSMAEADKRLAGRQDRVSVAVSNSPRSCVISGEPGVVREVIAECERDGVFCRLVKVDVASHSPQMDGPAAALAAELADLTPAPSTVPMYSTVLARPAEGPEFDAGYWGRNMRQPVRFTDTIAKLLDAGITVFVELGPHPLLVAAVQQTAQSHAAATITALACGRRDEPEQTNLLALVAHLWTAGTAIDWSSLAPGSAYVPLPSYPWQRERHWVRQAEARAAGAAVSVPELQEKHQSWLHCLRWRLAEAPLLTAARAADRSWLLVADDMEFARSVATLLQSRGHDANTTTPADLARTLGSTIATKLQGIVLLEPKGPDAAFAPVVAMQACSAAFGSAAGAQPPKLWLVTRGAQVVGAVTRNVAVDQGPLWGAGRVIAEEHPAQWGGLIDLDPGGDVAKNTGELVEELLASDGEDQVARRAGQRYVPRLCALEAAELSGLPPQWRTDGAYLITGGLGGIGLRIAAGMVARGVRRLVLLGRTALPARTSWNDAESGSATGERIAAVRALESSGATVHLLSADVSDAADLERALRSYANEAWPPIVGVVHAAGVLGNKLVTDMDRATFDRVLSPKLSGARNLDRLLPDVDLFILFSSTSSMLGIAGMSNYASANAGLDAIAAARVLRISPRKLDSRRPLGTMGLDSLMAIELRNRLEALLGRSLSATLAWNYPTVEALAAFLSGDAGVAPAAAPKAAMPAAEPDSLDVGLEEIIELSDEDVARELRAGGRG